MASTRKEKTILIKDNFISTKYIFMSKVMIIIRINPLIPKSDQHLTSPYNIIPESYFKERRIKKMVTN